jgi:hypothetical protein
MTFAEFAEFAVPMTIGCITSGAASAFIFAAKMDKRLDVLNATVRLQTEATQHRIALIERIVLEKRE